MGGQTYVLLFHGNTLLPSQMFILRFEAYQSL